MKAGGEFIMVWNMPTWFRLYLLICMKTSLTDYCYVALFQLHGLYLVQQTGLFDEELLMNGMLSHLSRESSVVHL